MAPKSIIPQNAKDLMIKDSDYSTPQDHYFAYISRKKDLISKFEDLDYEKHQKEEAII